MRPPLALVVFLALSPAAFGADIQADWRRDGVDDRVKQALIVKGWRLEDDGRALDPKTKAPATKAVLEKTVLDLRQDARRAALETAGFLLASGKPLTPEQRGRVEAMAEDLPPALASALLDPKSDMAKVKTLAGTELDSVAAYFDGGRTLADRRAAAQPVAAGTPGARVDLPYFTADEKAVGEKLRAAASSEIGRDPFGKTVLSRLGNDLPPIVIEDQNGPVVAQYDFRRSAVVLDRAGVVDSIVGAAPPKDRAALRKSLASRADQLAHLAAHPDAVTAVVKDNDVLLVHEFTHAWQDRRDPVFREMARGNLPDAQPLEYEEEAYKTKNLYIHSKLKNAPASVKMDGEFSDYVHMNHGRESWKQELFRTLSETSPARALPAQTVLEFQAARAQKARGRTAATADDQQNKALDILTLTRGEKQLAELSTAHAARMKALDAELDAAKSGAYEVLGNYYLVQALAAERSTDRSARLDQAERYAKAAGDEALLQKIRKAKDKKE